MKNTTRIIAVLLCLVMVLGLAACGGSGSGSGTQTSTNQGPTSSTTPTEKPSNEVQVSVTNEGEGKTEDVTQQQTSDATSARDTLTIATSGDNGTLMPSKIAGTFVGIVRQYMETLIDFKADGTMVYLLATDIEMSETEFIVHLREGVTFSNGNPFNADDLMFTINYYMSDPQQAMMFSAINTEGCEKIDEYTVKIALNFYSAMLIGSFSQFYLYDAESFNEDDMVMHPIGTGPYIVKDYVINSHVDLVANENYWGEKPKIKNLHYKVLNESAQVVNALETGEVDIAAVPAQDREYVATMDRYQSMSYYTVFTPTMQFNLYSDVVGDVVARRAICHALDREAICNLVYFGNATVLDFPVSMHSLDYTDDLANMDDTYAIGYNVELAKQLAEECGLVGKTVTIITNGVSTYVTEAEILQANLKDIGVEAKIVNYDSASYWSASSDPNNYDIALYAAASPQCYAVGCMYEYCMWSPTTYGAWDKYEDYLALGAAAVANPDPAARKDYLVEMTKLFEEAIPWFGICDQKNTLAINANLEGIEIWNSGILHLKDWYWAA